MRGSRVYRKASPIQIQRFLKDWIIPDSIVYRGLRVLLILDRSTGSGFSTVGLTFLHVSPEGIGLVRPVESPWPGGVAVEVVLSALVIAHHRFELRGVRHHCSQCKPVSRLSGLSQPRSTEAEIGALFYGDEA